MRPADAETVYNIRASTHACREDASPQFPCIAPQDHVWWAERASAVLDEWPRAFFPLPSSSGSWDVVCEVVCEVEEQSTVCGPRWSASHGCTSTELLIAGAKITRLAKTPEFNCYQIRSNIAIGRSVATISKSPCRFRTKHEANTYQARVQRKNISYTQSTEGAKSKIQTRLHM